MSEAAIRQKIYEIITAIPGIGRVHDYERWSADWKKFLDLMQDPATKRILGWEITRQSAPTAKISSIEEETVHSYSIQGYMSLDDASATEKTFQALIESLKAAFRGRHTLDNLAEDAGPLSLDICEPRSFGSVLCHYAKLTLPVSEIQ